MNKSQGAVATAMILLMIAFTSCEYSTMATDQESSPPQFSFTPIESDSTAMFSGQEDHLIASLIAHEMIARYERKFPNEPNGWYFGRDAILSLLAQDGVVGLRIYHALKEDGSYSPVIFGVTAEGKNVDVDQSLGKTMLGNHEIIILDVSLPCPPFCGPD